MQPLAVRGNIMYGFAGIEGYESPTPTTSAANEQQSLLHFQLCMWPTLIALNLILLITLYPALSIIGATRFLYQWDAFGC